MTLLSRVLSQCPGIIHGFGTRLEPFPIALQAEWNLKKPNWKQVHGCGVAQVAKSPQAVSLGEVDAMWTSEDSQPIAVVTADCVPILLARKDGKKVAAVHAGWRGTRAKILRALWAELEKTGETPSQWLAAVGPAIGPCCYEVSEELARDFKREFAHYGDSLAVPRSRILDLPAINHAELLDLGIMEVDLIRSCTRCEKSESGYSYFSYRREGAGTRQYSAIMISSGGNLTTL